MHPHQKHSIWRIKQNKLLKTRQPKCSHPEILRGIFLPADEGFTTREAIDEAKRCLHCKVPLCRKGCPIDNDIPEFVHQLSMGNIGAAMSVINERSNLPAICGRVCPHEKQCEGHCVLAKKGKSIQIGKIESFIADFDTKMELVRERLPQKTRGKIAVIGSGPAGLTVAGDLARQGFSVTIFEGQEEPGGVLMYGIPEYRLQKDVVRAELKKIEALGVDFRCGTMVGEHGVTVDTLFAEGFDAIFMGTGPAVPQGMPDTPGAQLRGVSQGTYFSITWRPSTMVPSVATRCRSARASASRSSAVATWPWTRRARPSGLVATSRCSTAAPRPTCPATATNTRRQ